MSDAIPILNRTDNPKIDVLRQTSPEIFSRFTETLEEFTENFSPEKQEKMQKKEIKKEKEQQNEFLEKLQGKFDKIGDTITQTTESTVKETSKGLLTASLGGFNMLFEPLKAITGIDVVGGISDSLANFFSPKKLAPKRSNVLKEGDIGSVLIADTISDVEEENGKKGNFLKNLLGMGAGALGAIVPMIGKLGLIGGIIWAIVDAVQGVFKAEEWGTSKVSAGIGGIFGGLSSGLKGAFGNMGKWALIGAGIGTFVAPVVGTLVGGLIGAGVGAILGFIGGENIAKAMDKVGQFFANIWTDPEKNIPTKVLDTLASIPKLLFEGILEFLKGGIKLVWRLVTGKDMSAEAEGEMNNFFQEFKNIFGSFIDNILFAPFRGMIDGIMKNNKLGGIWEDEDSTIGEKVGKTLFNLGEMIFGGIWGFIKGKVLGIWDFIKGFFKKPDKDKKKVGRNLLQHVLNFLYEIPKVVFSFLADMTRGFTSAFGDIPIIGDIVKVIGDVIAGIFDFIGIMAQGFQDFVDDPIKWLNDTVWVPVSNFFSTIGEGITGFITKIGDFFAGVGDFFTFAVQNFFGFITDFEGTSERMGEFLEEQAMGRKKERAIERLKERDPNLYKRYLNLLNTNPMMAENLIGDVMKTFHNGGMSQDEQLAILKKGEEVLSPYQSKMYRENNGYMSSRELGSMLGEMSKINSESSMTPVVEALYKLIDVTQKKDSGGNVVVNNNDSGFDPDTIRYKNIYALEGIK